MNRYIILFLFLLVTISKIEAQSNQFSQFFSTPLLINPALTGSTGSYRLSSNFRSQGKGSMENTEFRGYLSADFSSFKKALPENQSAGLGIYIMNDRSLEGALQTNIIGASTGYKVDLNEQGSHSVGIGFQGTYSRKKLDYTKLSFENQFNLGGYDPSAPIGEQVRSNSTTGFDMNAGIVYSAASETRSFFGGIAAYNILKHKENFLQNDFKSPTRFIFHGGMQLNTGNSNNMYFSVIHINQANTNQTTIGAAFGKQLSENDKNEITLGSWYRFKDAIIPYIGYQMNAFRAGFCYDYSISSTKSYSQIRNAFELSLIYQPSENTKRTIGWY